MTPALFLQHCSLQADQHLVLGLSGGLDSMVLLDLLAKVQPECGFSLEAVYINHGFSVNAVTWSEFCQQQCAQRQVKFSAVSLDITGRHNLEARARAARYQAFAQFISTKQHSLLTAHHADDQIETLLLALKRGAGPAGLSGIAAVKSFAAGFIKRPLLSFSQAQLQQYAADNKLEWVEDESNADTQFERNFVRHQITPVLQQRWPHFAKTASRSMQLLANMQQLADHYTEQFYQQVVADECLLLDKLAEHIPLQQDLLIRRWLADTKLNPSVQWLDTLYQTVIHARVDSSPKLMLAGYQVRRFANKLYKVAPVAVDKPTVKLNWHMNCDLSLSADLGHLSFIDKASSECLPLAVEAGYIVFGQLNLAFKPAGALQHKPLKQWFKLWQVPPWQRLRIPLVLDNKQQLIAVAGYAAAVTDEQALGWFRWYPADLTQ
ncbi:tRNA lysidine(34) synthetase TilS [Rheinheimera sp. WS51]|uniref:tRNA lysidine(34) synthetase TilS n=1 Tax=Rheinheimera sp. WS51 TaxID=3425886 RepID=UPI003D93623C